jgi:NAD(P)-dependent dehydrogenase (short-subunit alcohol dehydrogenase family)
VKGAYFTIQKTLPVLKDKSAIMLNASVAATIGMKGLSVYSATKAAIINLAKTLAADLSDREIRVNAISPSYTATLSALKLNEGKIESANAKVPFQNRFATPEEMGSTVLYLMSNDTSYMTGQNIIVDSGLTSLYN